MVLAACLMATACSPKPQGGTGKLKVATTVTMVTDLVKQIGGDRVEIQGLMGPGVDPHNYVPKLGDAGVLEKADVVFYSGLHLEGKMVETLEAMAKRGRIAVAVAEEGIPADRLLAPQEGFAGSGRVLVDAQTGEAHVVLAGLPSPGPGKTYELWAIRGSNPPEPAGLVDVGTTPATAARVERIASPSEVAAFALSIEPEGGSKSPTGPIVMVGKVT